MRSETAAELNSRYREARKNLRKFARPDAEPFMRNLAERTRKLSVLDAMRTTRLKRARALRNLRIRPPPSLVDTIISSRHVRGRMTEIIAATCAVSGLSYWELSGPGRSQVGVRWRRVAIALGRELTGFSMETIGEALGRDYSTVLHSLRKPPPERDLDAVRRRLT